MTFSQFSLKSWGQRTVIWKLPTIPTGVVTSTFFSDNLYGNSCVRIHQIWIHCIDCGLLVLFFGLLWFSPIHQFFLFICLETFWICYLLTYMLHGKNILINTIFYAFYSPGQRQFCLYYGLMKCSVTWGVSGPVVRALDSGSDGPGSSPGWGTTLWP